MKQKAHSKQTNVPTDNKSNSSANIPWLFLLDFPKSVRQRKRAIVIRGWFTPTDPQPIRMRLQFPDNDTCPISYRIKRPDVLHILQADGYKIKSDAIGFECECDIIFDGDYRIEAKIGKKDWVGIHTFQLKYEPEDRHADPLVPEIRDLNAQHHTLINSKQKYFHEPANQAKFVLKNGDPKLIAFYLPRFHTFKENDDRDGKGFTGWSEVTSAWPRFVGHEQPKLPGDFGFYNMKNEEVMRDQIELAKQHGLYGFCFYYYWFSGKRIQGWPLDSFLCHKEWDFNFMICWANDNWIRRRDGGHQETLIAQKHLKDDPIAFIKDIAPILTDPRYIRINDKPVLQVHRPKDLKNPKEYTQKWRDYFKKTYGSDLHLISVQGIDFEYPKTLGFDKSLSFVPNSLVKLLGTKSLPQYPFKDKQLDNNFTGVVYDYRKIALEAGRTTWGVENYQTVMPSWDNDARKNGSSIVFQNANPDIYAKWLRDVLDLAKPGPESEILVFLNAWNEWAEGAYLEPDKMYGHAYLNRTSEILAEYSRLPQNREEFPLYSIVRSKDVKLAIVIHLYYATMWPMIKKKLAVLPQDQFDLFITIPQINEDIRSELLKFKSNSHVMVVPNQGRDVLPFIHLGRRLAETGYEYVLKLHTKKSPHLVNGDEWMQDLLDKLVPSDPASFNRLMDVLERNTTGLIGPAGYFISLTSFLGSNRKTMNKILASIVGVKKQLKIIENLGDFGFFAGTMFWIRLDAIRPVLDQYYQPDDFEIEKGQLDGTFAHALERIFSIIPIVNRKSMYSIESGKLDIISQKLLSGKTEFNFVPQEEHTIQNDTDLELEDTPPTQLKPARLAMGGKAINIILKAPSFYSANGTVAANQIIRSVIDDRYHGPKLFPMTLPATMSGVKFIAESLDESIQSVFFQNLAQEYHAGKSKVPVEFHTFTPAFGRSIRQLREAGYRPKVHLDANIRLGFTAGDAVLINVAQPALQLKKSLLEGLDNKCISKILWFIPESKARQFDAYTKDSVFIKYRQYGRIKVLHVFENGELMNTADGSKVSVQKIVNSIRLKRRQTI